MSSRHPRQPVRNIRRYIHTQGFTRLSGNRRVEPLVGALRPRIVFAVIAVLLMAPGVYFAFF